MNISKSTIDKLLYHLHATEWITSAESDEIRAYIFKKIDDGALNGSELEAVFNYDGQQHRYQLLPNLFHRHNQKQVKGYLLNLVFYQLREELLLLPVTEKSLQWTSL